MKKPALILASLTLVAGAATGCGGDSDDEPQAEASVSPSPESSPAESDEPETTPEESQEPDSTPEESEPAGGTAAEVPLCTAFLEFTETINTVPMDASVTEKIATVKSAASKLAEAELPEDISPEAQEGFEVAVDVFQQIDDNATEEEMNSFQDRVSAEDQEKVTVFNEYLIQTCDVLDAP